MQKNLILAYYAQVWKFGPGPQKWKFSKIFYFCGNVSRFRFQRALSHPQTLSLSQVKQENVILAYYAQIWKIGPRLPKMEFFKIFSFLWKGLQISLLTSPQPLPDIKLKSSYARKRDFGLLCPNMEIRPQAPKNEIFQKIFIFLKRSPDFAPNEPSTTPDIKLTSSYARKRDYAQIWKFSPRLPKMEFFKNFSFF